jgi:hypothetical protein
MEPQLSHSDGLRAGHLPRLEPAEDAVDDAVEAMS